MMLEAIRVNWLREFRNYMDNRNLDSMIQSINNKLDYMSVGGTGSEATVNPREIKEAVESNASYRKDLFPIIICNTFEEAVKTASEKAESGDIVTLSPACASFDMFKNFMKRGERFKELVMNL